MKWTNRFVALAAAIVMMCPSVASAYYWYAPTTAYKSFAPTATTAQKATTMAAATGTESATTAVEQALLRLANQERVKNGRAPLQADSALTTLARLKSSDMVAKNYFSHTSPTYGTPAQMLAKNGISYYSYAENIAQGANADQIHAMWMASDGHRANILNPQLTRIGIGVVAGRSGYTATQIFIAR